MKVKISDVAKKAGVSTTTVSRVINGERYVSEEKRTLVENAIKSLGYTPNRMARSLVRQRTNLIGVIVPQVNLSFYYSIITIMEKAAYEQGYNLFICNTMHNAQKEFRYLKLCKEMQVDGLICMHEQLHSRSLQFIEEWGIHTVSASGEMDTVNMPSILIDNHQAAKEMTNHLLSLGHRHIHFIAGTSEPHATLTKRLAGFHDAINECDEDIIHDIAYGDYSLQSGYEAMQHFIDQDNVPTAVFAISDDVAIGAINCLKVNGKRVPEDITIVGFDGSDISKHFIPRLTTIEQPIEDIGRETVSSLIKLINGGEISDKTMVPYQLFIGGSCARLQGGERN
ncbi:LacI family DNA-binding transcriptional regulator [Pontibacillus litoralis]|uniref:LacI family transcription regulator n=1 Tax=Pontibacillus litoralis JSM 072002 TaxID=1385512 RepID=A0A0A5G3K2_9BACI|nr:LacI family DNA-binding transcriptional regulator [Pontibacillus litoralis]KGX86609.1 LacI family transcription regulator [Pontibacillus litoralis JSM 072002]